MKIKIFVLFLVASTLMLSSCGSSQPEIQNYTIGIINPVPIMDPLVAAFREGLTQSGYIDGVNVTYIYNGPLGMDKDKFKAEAQEMVAQEVDMIMAVTTQVSLAVQAVTQGTNIPVIFTPITDPVKTGMAESLEAPGGNMTGLMTGGAAGVGSLEMFLRVAPDVSSIYVPHNTEEASIIGLANLQEAADSLGVNLVPEPMSTDSEVEAAIASLPTDVDGVFLLLGSLTASSGVQWAEACLAAKLPLFIADVDIVENAGALMAYSPSFESIGKNTADIAVQVFAGGDPDIVPVGTAESLLYINLRTAQAIGLEVSDEVLELASFIYR
jgi:putative ABC transport system substrate-binding protein